MIDSLLTPVGFVVAFLVTILAFLKGDEPERIGAGVYVLGLFTALLAGGPRAPDAIPLAVEVILLAAFAGLAWKSRRSWLLWACGLQAVTILGHGLPPRGALVALVTVAGWGVMLALAAGVVLAWRDRRACGIA